MIQATYRNVVVELKYRKEIGSIILSDNLIKREGEAIAKVLSVGESVRGEIVEGDEVIVERNEGISIDKNIISINEDYILCKLLPAA